MATAEQYADWIVKNQDKRGTPEFETVAEAYKLSRGAPKAEQSQEGFGARVSREIGEIPRQLGLTARVGLQGIGNAVGMFSDPIGGLINTATGSKIITARSLASNIADRIGLPTPRTAQERIVADGAEMLVPAAGISSAAGKTAQYVSGPVSKALSAMSANPLQQLVSAGSAGLAGGYTRETGGDAGAQLLASLAAGVAAPYAMDKAQQGGRAVAGFVRDLRAPAPAAATNIDITINNAIKDSGMRLEDMPAAVQASIRQDVKQALNMNGVLAPDAVKRLADYRLVGATPTAGPITLDPGIVTRQKNAAKLGVNSKDAVAQGLAQTENKNNQRLIEILNESGANTAVTPRGAGERIIGTLAARDKAAKSLIDQRYAAARATDGRSAMLDPSTFTNRASDLLDEAMVGSKLPADVRNKLNGVATGEIPLTVDVAEQLKTNLFQLGQESTDGQERMALGLVRKALEDTPLLDGQGQQAIDAFNRARRLNRVYMGIVEKTPALQAVRDGVEPDRFVQDFIIGNGNKANVSDLNALRRSIKSDPEAMSAAREQIAAYLKRSAIGNVQDDKAGVFKQISYQNALKAIGEDKLRLFFTPDEIAKLNAAARVATYEAVQPKGAAVNNSNTGSSVANLLERIAGSSMIGKIPFGTQVVGDPATNILASMRAAEVTNVPNALLQVMRQQQAPRSLMFSPAAFVGQREERK